MQASHWLLAAVLTTGLSMGCDRAQPSDQEAQNTEDTGAYEVVRERAMPDGRLELRVRAEDLDKAERIARKLAERRKSTSQRIAVVEFIAMKDAVDGPARRRVPAP